MSLQLNGTDGVTFNDGSEQWAAASPIGTKNLIINGNMQIAQRGTSVSGLSSGYGYKTVDRFMFDTDGTVGTWTMSQDTDVPTGQGFANSVKYTCTAGATISSNASLRLNHYIEAQNLQHLKYGTANAESVTLSFWVKSNKTGTFAIWLYAPDNGRAISKLVTISSADTWEKKTLTYVGDTSGTINNDNGTGILVVFHLTVGTNFTSGTLATSWETLTTANLAVGQTINLSDTTSNYMNITGIQLEVGDTATPFEVMPYDMNLARCQRYYFKDGYGLNGASAMATGPIGLWYTSSDVYAPYYFPVEMRSAPTVSSPTVTSGYRWHRNATFSDVNNFGTTFNSVNRRSMYLRNTQVSGGTAGQAGWGTFNLSGTYVQLDAEL